MYSWKNEITEVIDREYLRRHHDKDGSLQKLCLNSITSVILF